MNRIYIYVMLFSGILFLNSMTCFAANEKLSASSRQTLDQLIRSGNRLEKLSRQDKDLRLLVQCDEHTTENDLLDCFIVCGIGKRILYDMYFTVGIVSFFRL